MAAVGVPFHATSAAAAATSSMAYEFVPSQSHGSSSSTSSLLDDIPGFDISDFITFDQPDQFAPAAAHQSPPRAMDAGGYFGNFSNDNTHTLRNITGVESGGGRRDETSRIAFRMKSEVETLDDGYKWRKYGKKSVKNSPNPRNYYRCSTEGCSVKKRVERDREDPSYVITTYEGTHNHLSPGVVYYASQDTVSGRYYVAGCQMPHPAAASSSSS
ncbi:hypothetical protein Cni_G09046 [Canna indica]|uniref:WRKY domain-containing protein n=1 Tax=Canna indica TaxID=4628 RepID=A0AAQ3K1T0_9LILI|nr:hypothetical protein Cni_G09046 [Canna indica]